MEFAEDIMKFTIKRNDFLNVLHACQGVIPAKGPKAILSYFHLKTVSDGIVVTATDIDNTISAEAPAKVVHEGAVAILAKMLLEIVRQLPDADILVSMPEDEKVKIKCGNSDFQLSGQPADEFPTAPGCENGPFFPLDCQLFGNMIRKAIIAIPSGEGSRYSMAGAQLSIAGNDITLLSTDGHRLSVVQRELIQPGKSQKEKTLEKGVHILLSKKALSEVKKIVDEAEGTILASFQNRHAIFKKDKLILISRLLENNYPDYRQSIPPQGKKVIKVDRVQFTQALKRVAVLSDERSHGIRLQTAGNNLVLESQDLELGDAHEEITVDYKEEEITVGLNVSYLLDALGVIDEKNIELKLKDNEAPCFIRAVNNPDYFCLIMPMKIED
jgi:DNA polymerase-3 subunit beta